MQRSANVSLSAFEKELVSDPGWILTKNKIIQKVYVLFGQLSEAYKQHPQMHQLPDELLVSMPKISKGENYEGLPYVMLDFPRFFSKDDVLAVRTFFWWGHFFSITLHLKGTYKKQYERSLLMAISKKQLSHAWINVSDEEWMHHFENNNMRTVANNETLTAKNVIKLAYKLELKEWDRGEEFLLKAFDEFMQLLTTNYYPNDETDL